MDQLATVIFSSGSTGDPKGVMLSHFNVMSNIGQVSQVLHAEAWRSSPWDSAVLPLLWIYCWVVAAGCPGSRRSRLFIPILSMPK